MDRSFICVLIHFNMGFEIVGGQSDYAVYLDNFSLTPVEEEEKVEYVTYTGDLTGYSADCPACNGTLACKPKYDVYKNGVVTYPDKEYGNVRIVATHQKNLKCGKEFSAGL